MLFLDQERGLKHYVLFFCKTATLIWKIKIAPFQFWFYEEKKHYKKPYETNMKAFII